MRQELSNESIKLYSFWDTTFNKREFCNFYDKMIDTEDNHYTLKSEVTLTEPRNIYSTVKIDRRKYKKN